MKGESDCLATVRRKEHFDGQNFRGFWRDNNQQNVPFFSFSFRIRKCQLLKITN